MKNFKRLTAILIVLVLAFSMISTVAIAASEGTIVLKSGYLNVRKSASTSAAIVAKVYNGDKVTVSSTSGDWYKISVGGKTGYVKKEFVKVSSSSSSSSSSSTSGNSVKVNVPAAKVYKTSSTSSAVQTTVYDGDILKIASETTSWYKVTANGKTGYIPKKNVTKVTSSSGGDSSSSSGTTAPAGGDYNISSTGGMYTGNAITAPAEPVTNISQMVNAINYNLVNFNNTFTIRAQNFSQSMVPTGMSQLEYAFTTGQIGVTPGAVSGGVTPVTFTVSFNDAGKVVASYVKNKAIASSDTTANNLKRKVDSILTSTLSNSMTDTQKVVALHDYVVKNVDYDGDAKGCTTAYSALINNVANCQGYAESMALLYSAAGIENRFVWAKSKMTTSGTHGFNKVKIGGKWYNVDATVDDPVPNKANRIRRDYLMVSDAVSEQRYSWDKTRYPASDVSNNNWHYQNDKVATSDSEFQEIVKEAIANKEPNISVWVEDYGTGKYKTSFIQSIKEVSSFRSVPTPAAKSLTKYAAAVYIELNY